MNNLSNVPPETDVIPGGGENVVEGQEEKPEEQLLKGINEATGRDYKTLEEAKKGMAETYKFIGSLGDIKEKAQAYDSLQTAKKTVKQEIDEKYDKVDRMEFIFNNPDAKDVVGDIASISKQTGKSMQEVYDNSALKRLVEKEKKEQEAAHPSFVASGQRLAPGEMAMSTEEFRKLPLEEQEKIVKKLPGWNEVIPKGETHIIRKRG